MKRELQQYIWQALKMYSDAIRIQGKPWPGWGLFERELASEFATLLMLLRGLPREGPRKEALRLFLDGLNLENKRGRTRKAKERLAYCIHGNRMEELWREELQDAWNMKGSLQKAGASSLAGLKRRFRDDVVRAVLARRATPDSSLAKVYADRRHVSQGTARNALREFHRLAGKLPHRFT
jgi:hypothetical protein